MRQENDPFGSKSVASELAGDARREGSSTLGSKDRYRISQPPKILPRAPRPFRSSVRWAGVAFAILLATSYLALVSCGRLACLPKTPSFAREVIAWMIFSGFPWVALFERIAGAGKPGLTGIFPLALGLSITGALLVLLLRYWVLRFKLFLALPLPPAATAQDRATPSPAPWALVLVVVFASLVFLVKSIYTFGFTRTVLERFVIVGGTVLAISLIPLYFEFRRRHAPNKTEIVLAYLWIAFRRTIAGLASLLFLLFAFAMFRTDMWMSAFGIFMFVFLLRLGWFGAGYRRTLADDVPSHKDRKRRYGWK